MAFSRNLTGVGLLIEGVGRAGRDRLRQRAEYNSEKVDSMRLPARCASIYLVLLYWCPLLLAQDGGRLYKQHCAACHDQVSPRIPSRSAIQKMSVRRVLRTMAFGLMMSIAYPLHREEREAIASFLGTGTDDAPYSLSAFCLERSLHSLRSARGAGQVGVPPFPTLVFNAQSRPA